MKDPITEAILNKPRDQWSPAETEWMKLAARDQAKVNRTRPHPVMEQMIAEEIAPQPQETSEERQNRLIRELVSNES
jgi:hypothetical protein